MKTSITTFMYLSRCNDRVYVGLDASTKDLEDFGITLQQFHDLGFVIVEAVKKFMEEQNGKDCKEDSEKGLSDEFDRIPGSSF